MNRSMGGQADRLGCICHRDLYYETARYVRVHSGRLPPSCPRPQPEVPRITGEEQVVVKWESKLKHSLGPWACSYVFLAWVVELSVV